MFHMEPLQRPFPQSSRVSGPATSFSGTSSQHQMPSLHLFCASLTSCILRYQESLREPFCWVWEDSENVLCKLRAIDSSLYTISAYQSFCGNSLFSNSGETCNYFSWSQMPLLPISLTGFSRIEIPG